MPTFFIRDLFYADLIRYWRLPPAASFFPDILFHALFLPWDFWPNLLFPLFSLSVLSGFGMALHFLLKEVEGRSSAAALTKSSASRRFTFVILFLFSYLGVLILYPTHETPYLPALLPGFHGASLLVSFILLVLFLRYLRKKSKYVGPGIVLLLALTLASDKIIAVYFVLPALGSILILYRRMPASGRMPGFLLAGVLLGMALSLLIEKKLPFVLSHIDGKERLAALSGSLPDWEAEKRYWKGLAEIPLICWIVLLAWMLSFLGVTRRPFRNPKILFVNYFVFFSVSANFLFAWLLLYPSSGLVLRYYGAAFILPLFVFFLNLAEFRSLPHHSFQALAWGVALAFLTGLAFQLQDLHEPKDGSRKFRPVLLFPKELLRFRPEEALCLQALAKKENLHTGLAEYWFAKPYEIYSGIQLNQIDLFALPAYWNTNPNRFLGNVYYDFLIVNRLRILPEKYFGPPAKKKTCGRLRIYLYTEASGVRLRRMYRFPLDAALWKEAQE